MTPHRHRKLRNKQPPRLTYYIKEARYYAGRIPAPRPEQPGQQCACATAEIFSRAGEHDATKRHTLVTLVHAFPMHCPYALSPFIPTQPCALVHATLCMTSTLLQADPRQNLAGCINTNEIRKEIANRESADNCHQLK